MSIDKIISSKRLAKDGWKQTSIGFGFDGLYFRRGDDRLLLDKRPDGAYEVVVRYSVKEAAK